jgi:hypothetical protein
MRPDDQPFVVIVVDRTADGVMFRIATDEEALRAILGETISSANEPPILDLEAVVVEEAGHSEDEDAEGPVPRDTIRH